MAVACVAAFALVAVASIYVSPAGAGARSTATKSPAALTREAHAAMLCLQSLNVDYVYNGSDESDGSPMSVYRMSSRLVQVTNLDYYGDPSTEQQRVSGRFDIYSSSSAANRVAKRDRRRKSKTDLVALRHNGVLYLYNVDNDLNISWTAAAMLSCIRG